MLSRFVRTSAFLWVLITLAPARLTAAEPKLAFRIDEGQNLNCFVRDGPVAAHLLLRSGTEPRILVAFPAGNSGVGLGLSLVTEHVRLHGGRVWVEDRPGGGARFVVELPVLDETEQEASE